MLKQYPSPPTLAIDPEKKYTATFSTSRGEIVVDLFAKEAPLTVNNFVFLARDKFYDGTTFHRVIANFMIQGGIQKAAAGRAGVPLRG
jgi:peptidyl-prolyl cis-trans isomerase B (cyclophilin B)